METRIKRLIAVGASVSSNCQPCLQHNVNKAKQDGVDDQEIEEAVEIGKMVRRGASTKMDEFAKDLQHVTSLISNSLKNENSCCS